MPEPKTTNPEGSAREERPDRSGVGGANLFAYISFFVAALSLVASMYQGYLNTRYVELIQTSVARAETARTCKDLIEAYFQIKFKAAMLAAAVGRERNDSASPVIAAEAEATNAVSRFAALGTYLANFQGEDKRRAYTQLSQELVQAVAASRTTPSAGVEKLFERADGMFGEMNDDCVRSATTRL